MVRKKIVSNTENTNTDNNTKNETSKKSRKRNTYNTPKQIKTKELIKVILDEYTALEAKFRRTNDQDVQKEMESMQKHLSCPNQLADLFLEKYVDSTTNDYNVLTSDSKIRPLISRMMDTGEIIKVKGILRNAEPYDFKTATGQIIHIFINEAYSEELYAYLKNSLCGYPVLIDKLCLNLITLMEVVHDKNELSDDIPSTMEKNLKFAIDQSICKFIQEKGLYNIDKNDSYHIEIYSLS